MHDTIVDWIVNGFKLIFILQAILKVAVNPCTDNDWEIIAGQMGPGWTGGDCRAQAERLEWKGEG